MSNTNQETTTGKMMVDNLKDELSTPERKQSLRDLTEETREKIKDALKQTFKPKKPGNAEAHWDARMKAQAMKTIKRRKANKAARRARKN